MPMKFKANILEALKDAGYNTNRIRIENLIPQGTLQHLRKGEPVGWNTIETLCELLHKQPGELLEYIPDQSGEK